MPKQNVSCIHLLFLIAAGSIVIFVFSAIFPASLHAQVTPAEGSKLNYRIIGFSFPAKQEATQYVIEIANGNLNNNKDFKAHLYQAISCHENKTIIEVPDFGNEYTWQVIYKHNNSIVARSELYHFATGAIRQNGPNATRLKIKANTQKYTDAYILIDGSNTMYDIKGIPVWYFPDTNALTLDLDVKASHYGTITFLARESAYEISYNGKILWDAKNKYNINDRAMPDVVFHHEFNELRNGHYMALVARKPNQGEEQVKEKRKRFFPSVHNSTLAEFDTDGNVVWSWESSEYMQRSDLGILQQQYPNIHIDMHENAFYFDEKDSVIYISMSEISRIVKIQYPSGNVLGEYGNIFTAVPSKAPDSSNHAVLNIQSLFKNKLFSRQHSLSHSDNCFLYTFNNNNNLIQGIDSAGAQILRMKESGDTLEKVWNFDCNLICNDRKLVSGSGGNIVVLPDNSLFVSMSVPYGDMFIVDTNKNILWSAVYERYQPNEKVWVDQAKYRASIVTRKQLEQMIWREQ